MHIQTHILSGWLVSNALRLTPRERFFCMTAAAMPDLDGLGIVVSEEWYGDLHHKLGHNVFFFAVVAGLLAAFSKYRLRAGLAYFGLGWVHFALDYLGSGPGWALYPWWPVAPTAVEWQGAWAFFSWQNITAFCLMFVATLWIAWRWRRTPLEWAMPRLDAQLVALLDPRKPQTPDAAPS